VFKPEFGFFSFWGEAVVNTDPRRCRSGRKRGASVTARVGEASSVSVTARVCVGVSVGGRGVCVGMAA
jgi:hypothetical protein